MDQSTYRLGLRHFAQMVSECEEDSVRAALTCVPDIEHVVLDVVGAEIWARPNLELKVRSLCSLGILAALGRVNALELNVRIAVRHGATRTEIMEVMLHVAAYAGFAAAWDALDRIDGMLRTIESERMPVAADDCADVRHSAE
jgi:4-carboxymuconolactone decarboxylase